MATIAKRVSKGTGAITWQARVRISGEKPRVRTFRRKSDAKAWAAAIESDLARGAYVPDTTDRRRTLADLIDLYQSQCLPFKDHNRDAATQQRLLSWWRENLGYVSLDRLKPSVIADARMELGKRTNRYGTPISGATKNRYLAALSAVCKYAHKELHWLRANPVLAVSKSTESAGVIRYLSDDERRRLFTACREHSDPNILTFVTLALATGLRYSNIRFLQWESVDLDAGILTVERTKNGDGRRVPLIASATLAMRAHYQADPTGQGWVFKGQRDNAPASLDMPWRQVRESAKLDGFRFHDLRHTTASYLTQSGAGLAQVADALGHKTLAMARRYSHQGTEHVRSTLEGIADKLGDPEL